MIRTHSASCTCIRHKKPEEQKMRIVLLDGITDLFLGGRLPAGKHGSHPGRVRSFARSDVPPVPSGLRTCRGGAPPADHRQHGSSPRRRRGRERSSSCRHQMGQALRLSAQPHGGTMNTRFRVPRCVFKPFPPDPLFWSESWCIFSAFPRKGIFKYSI